MIQLTQTKKVQSVWPQARINNSAVTCASIDRRGFDYAVVRVAIGATDIGFTTFKLQESDDNSTFTDISGADYSVSPLTLPSSSNSNTTWEWQVDLRGSRKRYLRPAITIGNGTSGAFVAAEAELFRAEQTPYNASNEGLAGVAVV
ncbi:MAG TPA: hypothetical protein VN541_07125 [Tepidisphaeraceae bacterium]|nr:hypothetical protein [Tepidisphaeraceae bacterium]